MDWGEQARALLTLWTEGQKALLEFPLKIGARTTSRTREGQESQEMPNGSATGDPDEISAIAELWRSYIDLWSSLGSFLPNIGDGEGPSKLALLQLLSQNLKVGIGGSEIGETIRRLTEGPTLIDLWEVEGRAAEACKARLELRRASDAYNALLMDAWKRAFQQFAAELNERRARGESFDTRRAVLDLWIDMANHVLLETQRTKEFLDSQGKVLRAGMRYRKLERAIIETFCEVKGIPTRSELDEVHKSVRELRREVRALRHVPTSVRPGRKSAGSANALRKR